MKKTKPPVEAWKLATNKMDRSFYKQIIKEFRYTYEEFSIPGKSMKNLTNNPDCLAYSSLIMFFL